MTTLYCFGDSITHGENDHERGGWAERLKAWCLERRLARGADEVRVFNLGIGGENTDGLRKRFLSELDARIDGGRSVVLLAYGANDVAVNGGAPKVTIDAFIGNLRWCITETRRRRAEVRLLTITPVSRALDGVANQSGNVRTNARIGEYNAAIEGLAKSARARLIDVGAGFVKEGAEKLLSPDGVHPNPAGHEVIYSLVKEQLGL